MQIFCVYHEKHNLSSTRVPGDIFDKVKGRDITITIDMGNGIQISLAYEGEFGFTAVLAATLS